MVSALFSISINSGAQWTTGDAALWSHCCNSYHQMMTFVWETQGLCENCSSCTSCLCSGPAAEPTNGRSPPSQHLGKKRTFSCLKTQISKVPSPLASLWQRFWYQRPDLNWVSYLKRAREVLQHPQHHAWSFFLTISEISLLEDLYHWVQADLCGCVHVHVTERGLAGWKVFAHSSTLQV